MIIAIKGLSRHKGPADASSTNRLSRTTRQALRSRPHALSAKIHPRDSGFIGESCTTTNGRPTPKDSVRQPGARYSELDPIEQEASDQFASRFTSSALV